MSDVRRLIGEECDALKQLLLEKNRAYGNSALDPVRVFSKASPREQLLVRIDDKISRLARGSEAGEDVVKDLLGYLILLRVADRFEKVEEGVQRNKGEDGANHPVENLGSRTIQLTDPFDVSPSPQYVRRLPPGNHAGDVKCMSEGCFREGTLFEETPWHWHDWAWCDQHAPRNHTGEIKDNVRQL